ncbi:MAG TPA: hypothetical protein VEK08_00215 [Planctomycetota bacterium]|nr:hypothetical protein [Planctomycetota bacterium]
MRNVLLAGFLITGLMLGTSAGLHAAEKGKRFNRNKAGGKAERERAVMGDGIAFALAHDDDLKLNAQQVEFLQKLRKSLEAEREKEKEEAEIKELMQRFRAAKRQGHAEAPELKQRARALMEKQAEKWEERTNKELERVLPKEYLAKLRELRGDPEKLAENPFD